MPYHTTRFSPTLVSFAATSAPDGVSSEPWTGPPTLGAAAGVDLTRPESAPTSPLPRGGGPGVAPMKSEGTRDGQELELQRALELHKALEMQACAH